MKRTFTEEVATSTDGTLPLMISLMGFAHSGKSMSSLRLATGIQRVTGDEIWAIGTEGNALKMYAKPAGRFTFKHVRLSAPFGAADYHAAIDHCISKGARLIVIDNMSYEHTGEGGLLDMRDREMEERIKRAKARGDRRPEWKLQNAYSQPVWAEVKRPRTLLERRMETLRDDGVIFIMTFRADERYIPKKADPDRDDSDDQKPAKTEPEHQWKVEGTSELPYISTLRWLLDSGCDGRATFVARSTSERKMTKTPECFRELLSEGQQLTEELGERIARICRQQGTKPAAARGGRVLFHRDYGEATGEVAQSDPPTVSDYIHWLELRETSPALLDHLTKVLEVQSSMLQREAS